MRRDDLREAHRQRRVDRLVLEVVGLGPAAELPITFALLLNLGAMIGYLVFNGIGVYASPFGYSTKVGEFTAPGAYPTYAAMVSNHRTDVGSKIVTATVDFGAWYTPYGVAKDDPAPFAARATSSGSLRKAGSISGATCGSALASRSEPRLFGRSRQTWHE